MDESIFLVAKKLKNAAFGENLLQEKNALDFGLLKRGRKSCRAKRCKRVRPYSLRNSQLNTMIQIMALNTSIITRHYWLIKKASFGYTNG